MVDIANESKPTGCFSKNVSSPVRKNISVFQNPNHLYKPSPFHNELSLPGLTRQSINLRKRVFRSGWMAGSPVYAKASPGFHVLVRRSPSEGGSPAMTRWVRPTLFEI
jgi:hypothetical protein